MTLNKPITLEEYFHVIVDKTSNAEVTIGYEPSWVLVPCNQPLKKEPTMFEKTKMFFTEQLEKINSLLTKPTAFEDTVKDAKLPSEEGYWTFEMYTPEYLCDDGVVPEQSDTIFDLNDATWMDTLDQILDVMGKHYGYNIKDQVYYSVSFPNNELSPYTGEVMAGHGRMLNDAVLQQLLLAFPEVYERNKVYDQPKNVFE